MTPARPLPPRPRLAHTIGPTARPCPLPHHGRDVVLLAGLSAAAAEIRDHRETIGGFDDVDAETGEASHVSGLVDLVVQLDVARHRAVVEGHREQETLADEWRHARAVEWERAEAAEEALAVVLAGEAQALWAVRVLAARLDAALATLPALEEAAANGGRRALAAALEPLAAALRGQAKRG